MAELGIDGKIATNPGTAVAAGYSYRSGSRPGGGKKRGGGGGGGGNMSGGRQQGMLGLSLNYIMKNITFMNEETGQRTISQQPPALTATEGRISLNERRLYTALIFASKDYSFVESISATEIVLVYVPVTQAGIEIGLKLSPARSFDLEMSIYGSQTSARDVGQLRLVSGDCVGGKINIRLFNDRWFEIIASTERTSFTFSDSKQASLQADIGFGFRF